MRASFPVASIVLTGLMLAGCAAGPQAATSSTATVVAVDETRPVGTVKGDAADDPAIWRDPSRPEASLIVATDKKAGLYVYGLDGGVRDFVPAGRVNNVDLIDLGGDGVIVVASDRNDEAHARLLVYRLDARAAKLVPLGSVDGGDGEAYGVCLMTRGGNLDGTAEGRRTGHARLRRPRAGRAQARGRGSRTDGYRGR